MSEESDSVGLQLRLAFTSAPENILCQVSLAGLTLTVTMPDMHVPHVLRLLQTSGAQPSAGTGLIRVPVVYFLVLASLPAHVHLIGDQDTTPLLTLLDRPSYDNLPAVLDAESSSLTLSWFDGHAHWSEAISIAAGTALLHTGLPVVATGPAWEVLRHGPDVPVVAGWCRTHEDGYVVIDAALPQRVAASDLPALWRIDDTTFGLPSAYAYLIGSCPDLRWASPPPHRERIIDIPDVGVELSSHTSADLSELVSHLLADGAQVLAWESGLGRRIAALAALSALDDFPLLVVCHGSAVFAWRRHADLLGKTASILKPRSAEVTIITYADLVSYEVLPSFSAVIFDELPAALRLGGEKIMQAVHRFDALTDAHRLITTSAWPQDPGEATSILSVARPGEFAPGSPLEVRYPSSPTKDWLTRASEHARVYISERFKNQDLVHDFHRSSVVREQVTDEQYKALIELQLRVAQVQPSILLAQAEEIGTLGSLTTVSPKIASAAQIALDAASSGGAVAILTRHPRAATLLRAAIGMNTTDAVDADSHPDTVRAGLVRCVQRSKVAVVTYSATLPDLRIFSDVVFIDYPYSLTVLDRAVGSAGDTTGVPHVSVVHLTGSIDDRLAVLAATRAELAGRSSLADPPNDKEISYLLTPRRGW